MVAILLSKLNSAFVFYSEIVCDSKGDEYFWVEALLWPYTHDQRD